MANVLYDKTSCYPSAGSLREALFLHVWLRRQGIEIERARILAQGLASKENLEFLIPAYESFISTLLPYMKEKKKVTDTKMLEALKKEVEVGKVPFQILESPQGNILRNRATALSAPDEYRQRLAQGVAKRARLRK
jgi:hypothetical protein